MKSNLTGNNAEVFDIAAFIAQTGQVYEKRPGLSGFTVLYTEDETFRAYNRLEDVEYQGSGYYIKGLVGEIWKTSFDSLTRSYVFDNGPDDEQCALYERLPQDEEVPIRYRNDIRGRVLAARAPESLHEIETRVGEDTFTLSFNALNDRDEKPIDHGQGDYLVIPMAIELEQVSLQVIEESVRSRSCYVINGAVFSRTYQLVETDIQLNVQ